MKQKSKRKSSAILQSVLAFCLLLFLALFPVLPADRASAAETGDYIFPYSAERYLTEEELADVPPQVLSYGKNEIYARHGRIFSSPELTAYFSTMPWYRGTVTPDAFSEKIFNDYEYQNVLLLDEYQQRPGKGYALNQPGYDFEAVEDWKASIREAHTPGFAGYDSWQSAYRLVLEENADTIRAYDWQAYGGSFLNVPMPVAFCDLDGDETPELLYMDKPTQDPVGYLNVWTYREGELLSLFRRGFDVNVAGGCRYCVFQDSWGGFFLYTSMGDENWADTLEEFRFDSDGAFFSAGVYMHESRRQPDYTYLHSYTRDGELIDRETYTAWLEWVWEVRGDDLLASWYGDGLGDLPWLPSPEGMSLDAARKMLTEEGAPVVSAEDSIYLDFIRQNWAMFAVSPEEIWYYIYDIDADGSGELIVRFPSGVRSAVRMFSHAGGEILNIVPNLDQTIFGVDDIYPMAGNAGGIVVCTSGGASTEYYIFFSKQGEMLEPYMQLQYDYDSGKAWYFDTEIPQDRFEDYLSLMADEPLYGKQYEVTQ